MNTKCSVLNRWWYRSRYRSETSHEEGRRGVGGAVRACRWHMNLELDNDDVQELLDSHNKKLTIDQLIEMHEQQQDIEKF
ncbi:hypothetical protein TNCV_3659131 [Trichonephila clavipes]|nr:hypothetical protein TNCV_3659131 [Trichonephila clavipes]